MTPLDAALKATGSCNGGSDEDDDESAGRGRVVVSIGPAQASETIRTGLAMGAGPGILVESDGNVEPLAVAKIILKKVADEEQQGLMILGKQAIGDSNQTRQMLAALLSRSRATFASKLEEPTSRSRARLTAACRPSS